MKRRAPWVITVALSLLVAAGVFSLKSVLENSRPRVILITVDALRPDHLGCYGYGRRTSPHIDQLAKEGVLFTQAVAQGAWTLPSNLSLLTSTSAAAHLIVPGGAHKAYLNPGVDCLPQILKKNGIRTAFITDQLIMTRIHGLKEQFDHYAAEALGDHAKVTQQAIEWIKKNKRRPYFLWVYYLGSHAPYAPDAPYNDLFMNDGLPPEDKQLPLAAQDNEYFGVIPTHVVYGGQTSVNYYIAQYDGKILLIDEEIGRLLSALEKEDRGRNTCVILISDHGEGFGEHGMYFRHGGAPYEELLKVPLVLRWAGRLPRNTRVGLPVELLDIAPTILDAFGIQKPASMQGASLRSFFYKKGPKRGPYSFSYSPPFSSVRSQGWKLIHIDRKFMMESAFWAKKVTSYLRDYEFYDLKSDPGEKHDLADEKSGDFIHLKQILDAFEAQAKGLAQESTQKIKEHYKIGAPEEEAPDKEEEQKLRSLGYVQ